MGIRSAPTLCLCLLFASGLPTALLAEDAERRPDPGPQVVVLHNGSVIQGRVEKTHDRLIVSNGPWYVVRIPLTDVDFVARDLAVAYRMKRARLDDRDFDRHLQLAQWCLRHDLVSFAADQLLHLSHLDPHRPAVEALKQQLLRRAQHVEPDETAATELPTPDTEPEPDAVEQQPAVSSAAVGEFTRVTQPLLLNRCGQTTCHGSVSRSVFQLQRLRASGIARKDLTLKNLRAAAAQIDLANPPESPLLTYATRPHGPSSQAPLGAHETRQYEHLLAWVRLTAADEPVDAATTDAAIQVAARAKASFGTPASADDWYQPATDGGERDIEPVTAGDTAASGEIVASDPDPYDPATFNARFRDVAPITVAP